MLEITVGHLPFSEEVQYLANQYPLLSAKFNVRIFLMGQQSIAHKMSHAFQKMADHFLTLLPLHHMYVVLYMYIHYIIYVCILNNKHKTFESNVLWNIEI